MTSPRGNDGTRLADAHRVPGAVWDFGKTLASRAIRMKTKAL